MHFKLDKAVNVLNKVAGFDLETFSNDQFRYERNPIWGARKR